MTLEVDALIKFFTDSGLPFRVTDINTPGVHAPESWHYCRLGHASRATGDVSTSIDIAAPEPSRDSPELDALFNAALRIERDVTELVYAHAPFNIKNGLRVPIYDFADNTNTHVHIAVKPGVLVKWSPLPYSAPAPAPQSTTTTTEDDDMPKPDDKIGEIVYPTGHKTTVLRDGSVDNWGTPFMGSINDLLPAEKQGWTEAGNITAEDPNDESKGYCVYRKDGAAYHFTPAEAAIIAARRAGK